MIFTELKDAVEYAKQNNQDVQKQNGKWVTIDKPVISPEKRIEDLTKALEYEKSKENPDNEIISQMEEDLEKMTSN